MQLRVEHRQGDALIRCEWGRAGVAALAASSDAVVIVDVLSFSTSVDLATARGGRVFPYRFRDASAADYAREQQALLAGHNELGLDLRPHTLVETPADCRLVLPSPNGSTLSILTGDTPTLAGCLRNAGAVAAAARAYGPRVAVIPAGEEWPDRSLRPAFEDLCGAGAVISHLPGSRSPEAAMAEAVFADARPRLAERLAGCVSGVEKRLRDLERDVELAAELDASEAAPRLAAGAYTASVAAHG